jgi:hypothetical protein
MMHAFSSVAANCRWSYLTGEPFDEQLWRQYIQTCFELSQQLSARATMLTLGLSGALPPPSARRELARHLKQLDAKLLMFAGSAMVFDSALARGSLTAINWIVKKPYPEKVFADVNAALTWLSSLRAEFDAEAVWSSIESSVPKHLLHARFSIEEKK